MADGFNIRDFRASINNYGILKSNAGQILFTAPEGLRSNWPDVKDILIRCQRASVPAIWFTTDDNHRRFGYGPADKIPQVANFDPMTVEFLVDRNADIYLFFVEWMMLISNFDSSSGMTDEGDASNDFGKPYEMSYAEDYTVDLFTSIYNEDTRRVMNHRMIKAFPSAMHEIPFAHGDLDNYIKLMITFQYRDWRFSSAPSDGNVTLENEF